ncbi:homoserine O-acetyltransferase [bacterium]|nr:homoserine O-acetyltransferase [bacterium]
MSESSVRNMQFFTAFTDEPLPLDGGQLLSNVTISYETYGTLNSSHSNAVLVCHPLSGDSHASSLNTPGDPGWWDTMIGENKPIDTNRYFVICTNVIGGCKGSTGPASINPLTQVPFGLNFPVVTIGDMVNVQYELIRHLGIDVLHCVIGGSMGGMQALEWAIKFPNHVRSVVPIAATARLSPQSLAFDAVGRNAIILDQSWNNGFYYGLTDQPEKGLAIARMIGHITYLSDEAMTLKFGRNLQKKTDYGYDFSTDFQVESYLKYQGEKFVSRFDANSYLYLTKAISYFDLYKKYDGLENAFKSSTARFLIISISSDWLYPSKQSKDIVKSLMKINKDVSFAEIQSPYGHDAFLMPCPDLEQLVTHFLGHHVTS